MSDIAHPPGLGEALLEFVVRHDADLSIGEHADGTWMVALQWGQEAPDSPMVGAAAYGANADMAKAIEHALSEANVNPCGRCGWTNRCKAVGEDCHS